MRLFSAALRKSFPVIFLALLLGGSHKSLSQTTSFLPPGTNTDFAGQDRLIDLSKITGTPSFTLTSAFASLSTTVRLRYQWEKLSGPACTISSPTAAKTSVTGIAEGSYEFKFTVSDGTNSASDRVKIGVISAMPSVSRMSLDSCTNFFSSVVSNDPMFYRTAAPGSKIKLSLFFDRAVGIPMKVQLAYPSFNPTTGA